MRRMDAAVPVHGAVGGTAAGAAVMLWFLVLDLGSGQPLETPESLARVLFGLEAADGFRPLAFYTLLHFGVYAVLGMAVAGFLAAVRATPGLLAGFLVGTVLLNATHYGALLATGAELLSVLPPNQVVAANLMAGLVMMTYLHYALAPDSLFGLATLRQHPALTRGLLTGFLGAGAVAAWFLVVDVFRGQPFLTPAALGSAAFLGASSPAEVQLTVGVIAGYTVLHLIAFGVVGVAFVTAAEWLERSPGMWLMALMAFIMLEGLFLVGATSAAAWLLGALSWWAVGLGNLLAVVVMTRWVWSTHPELRRQLRELPPVETRV